MALTSSRRDKSQAFLQSMIQGLSTQYEKKGRMKLFTWKDSNKLTILERKSPLAALFSLSHHHFCS